jgi:HK97 family phage portal protein
VAFHGAGRVAWSARDSSTLTRVGFLGNPVAFRCVKLIAEAAAAVPVVVQDADRRFDVHPVIDLLAAPNPGQSGAALLEGFYGHLLLSGDGYLEAAGEVASGGPRELYVLRSDRMKVVPGSDGWPVAYEYSAGGQKHVFEMRQDRVPVLHVKGFHPQDDHYGLSPLAAAPAAEQRGACARHSRRARPGTACRCGSLATGPALRRRVGALRIRVRAVARA